MAPVKLSLPGYDVKSAGDINLAFSSEWPAISVAKEITTTQFNGQSTGSIAHGLDFVPFTIGWSTVNGVTQEFFPNVDNTNVYLNDSFPNPFTFGTVHYKCFNVDLTTSASYKFIQPPAPSVVGAPSSSLVFKLAKPNKDIQSSDLRDYLVHSRCQSPQVLQVVIGNNASGGTLTYTSPLGYVSWVFGYVYSPNWLLNPKSYLYAPYFAQAYPITRIDTTTNTASLQYIAGDTAVLVVLRDPLFASTSVEASF